MHTKPHSKEAKAKISASKLGKPLLNKRRETKVIDGIVLYKCCNCKDFYPYENFYKNNRTLLGIKGECKKCHVSTAIKSRNVDNHREQKKINARKVRLKNPEKVREKERANARLHRYPDRERARNILNRAVKSGKLQKPTECQDCHSNGKKINAHHGDYSKPLLVVWLCTECHGKRHRITPFPSPGKVINK